jgi:hypothetical protein
MRGFDVVAFDHAYTDRRVRYSSKACILAWFMPFIS